MLYRLRNPFGWLGWGIVLVLVSAFMFPLRMPGVAQWVFLAGLVSIVLGVFDKFANPD
jgi:hypothetical protein